MFLNKVNSFTIQKYDFLKKVILIIYHEEMTKTSRKPHAETEKDPRINVSP